MDRVELGEAVDDRRPPVEHRLRRARRPRPARPGSREREDKPASVLETHGCQRPCRVWSTPISCLVNARCRGHGGGGPGFPRGRSPTHRSAAWTRRVLAAIPSHSVRQSGSARASARADRPSGAPVAAAGVLPRASRPHAPAVEVRSAGARVASSEQRQLRPPTWHGNVRRARPSTKRFRRRASLLDRAAAAASCRRPRCVGVGGRLESSWREQRRRSVRLLGAGGHSGRSGATDGFRGRLTSGGAAGKSGSSRTSAGAPARARHRPRTAGRVCDEALSR